MRVVRQIVIELPVHTVAEPRPTRLTWHKHIGYDNNDEDLGKTK